MTPLPRPPKLAVNPNNGHWEPLLEQWQVGGVWGYDKKSLLPQAAPLPPPVMLGDSANDFAPTIEEADESGGNGPSAPMSIPWMQTKSSLTPSSRMLKSESSAQTSERTAAVASPSKETSQRQNVLKITAT